LFNMAAKNVSLAEAIAEAVFYVDPELVLVGFASGELVFAKTAIGIRSENEIFADRTYQVDGAITSRGDVNADIKNHRVGDKQRIHKVKEGKVTTSQRTDVTIQADTVCIHGDGENTLDFAKYISTALKEAGTRIAKIGEFLE